MSETHAPNEKKCRNCDFPLPEDARFCPRCSQMDSDGRVRFRSMLRHLWESTFQLDGKFIRTSWQLFIPGKVTQEYFKGRQVRYPHPLRLFAIVMFFFLWLLNNLLGSLEAGKNVNMVIPGAEVELMNPDSSIRKVKISGFELLKYNATLNSLQEDYQKMPAAWKNEGARQVADSLFRTYARLHGLKTLQTVTDSLSQGLPDSLTMGINGVGVALLDVARMEPDEILNKYGIKSWIDRTLAKQTIKSLKTPAALVHAYMGSLTWTILVLIAVMALVLGLLYWRQHRYYVEHFIFLLHLHTGIFLLLVVAIAGSLWEWWGTGLLSTAFLAPIPGVYLGMKRYYGNGWGKTFVKFLLFGLAYMVAFILAFTLGLFAVFAFF